MGSTSQNNNIDDIAASWAATTMSGDMSQDQQAALDEWLAEDDQHMEAFQGYMNIIALSNEAVDLSVKTDFEQELETLAQKQISRSKWQTYVPAIAACIAGFMILGALVIQKEPTPLTYATLLGERTDIGLDDGSVVTLNTNSIVDVTMSSKRRFVTLRQGEALFEIARDERRPFLIDAGDVQISVLGTKFNVDKTHGQLEISVLHGIVEVERSNEKSSMTPDAVMLMAGEQVSIGKKGEFSEITSFIAERITGWRHGRVYYEKTTLQNVLQDLNRYYENKISVSDASINAIPVTGSFNIDDQSVVVEALSAALSLTVTTDRDGNITLAPNKNG